MSEAALDDLVQAWLRARPELASARPYLGAAEREPFTVLACLEQQWLETLYGVAETDVASAKLGWWLEELKAAQSGQARHPFTRTLFADARARAIDAALWRAPIAAAMALREPTTCANLAAQLALDAPLFETLAQLENALWFGRPAPADRAARLAGLGHLLAALGRLEQAPHAGASALPMNLLARHQLAPDDLARDDAHRTAAIHDQLEALDSAWAQADQQAGPLSLFRTLAARADRLLLHRARRSARPLRVLVAGQRRIGLRDAWAAWRLARAWRAG